MQFGGAAPATDRVSGLANWLGGADRSRGWRAYAFAAAAVAVTTLVRVILEVLFDDRSPTYLIFLTPVVLSALFGGFRPGVAATIAGWAISHFFFIEPTFSFKATSDAWVVAGVFLVEGLAISAIGGRLNQTVRQLVDRERDLAASEARLVMARQAARIATYEWHPATGKAVWSENAEAIMGMSPGSFRGTYEDSIRTVLPADRPLIDAAAEALREKGSNEAEYRVLAEDGSLRWIHATGTWVRGGSGSGLVVGVMMDVTQRRRAAEHAEFLADATAELGRSLDFRANVGGLATAAVPRFADAAVVVLVAGGQTPGEVIAVRHKDAAKEPLLRHLQAVLEESSDTPGLAAQAIRTGVPLYLPRITPEQIDRITLSQAHRDALHALDLESAICAPLSARGTTLGGLVYMRERGSSSFEPEDFALATELGRRASLAIENSLLLEQSFEREGQASRANEALQLIADAGMALNATLDLSETLDGLARLVVPRFADVCSVNVMDGDKLERAAVVGRTKELEHAVESLSKSDTPDRQLLESAGQVLRSDRPIYLPQIPEDLRERMTATAGANAMAEMKPKSIILMPLSARGQTIGVMTFLRTDESAPFDRDDLSLAGQIARRTAISADNARLYAEARRANDAKDEFLGMMSHELRTPITVIHGGARVLRSRSGSLDDETRDGLLHDIERESERLSRMLENLLALARAELDREVVLEPVLLQRLLPRLVDGLVSASGRPLTLDADADLPAVSAEPGYIEHIVRNLVSNAIKYSPPEATIAVAITRCGQGAAIHVRDRGFGIGNDEAKRIFERFYRSDRTSRLAGGAGLGLAVCKRLVEAMSGEIWANPREGGGLEVGFSLPPYLEENSEL